MPTAEENCSKMPVLRHLSKVFRRRRGSIEITPVVDTVKEISSPTGFKHDFHVGFADGKFVGLPPAWNQWLNSSNISYVCFIVFTCLSFLSLQYTSVSQSIDKKSMSKIAKESEALSSIIFFESTVMSYHMHCGLYYMSFIDIGKHLTEAELIQQNVVIHHLCLNRSGNALEHSMNLLVINRSVSRGYQHIWVYQVMNRQTI